MKTIAILLAIFTLEETNLHCQGRHETMEEKLVKHLQKNYVKSARPTLRANDAINVTFGMSLKRIVEVSWKNMLMTWNASEWGGIEEITFPNSDVWTPDILLYNAAGDTFPGGNELYKTNILARPDGTHSWNSPVTFYTTCSLNIRYFPFDKHTCYYLYSSWSNDQGMIDLFPEDTGKQWTADFIEGQEWHLLSGKVERYVTKFACCDHPYVQLKFTIQIKRRSLYFTLTLVIPCLFLLPLTIVTFYLPPESGERTGLTITILLAVAVFLQITSDNLPRFSKNIPFISLYFICIMGTTAMSLVITGFVLAIHFKGESSFPTPVPNWLKRIFFGRMARFLKVREAECWRKEKENKKPRALVYQNGSVKEVKGVVCETDKIAVTEMTGYHIHEDMSSLFKQVKPESSIDTKILLCILQQTISQNKIKDDTLDEEKVGQEWKILAKVIDRILLALFVIVCIIFTLGLLLPVYLY